MKRRSFIKILSAALLSPFLPSGALTSEIAIPDPALKPYPMSFTLDQRRRPGRKRITGSHLDDALQYAMMDHEYYTGSQWRTELLKAQRKLNMQRSLILNKIIK